MTPSEYQKAAGRTDLPNYIVIDGRLENNESLQRLIHYGFGMVTEAGEFIDQLKKHLMYGKNLDAVNLREELGDLLWYISRALTELDTTFEAVMAKNIEKLKARFPEKFIEAKALNRDLKTERNILEAP